MNGVLVNGKTMSYHHCQQKESDPFKEKSIKGLLCLGWVEQWQLTLQVEKHWVGGRFHKGFTLTLTFGCVVLTNTTSVYAYS